MGRSRGQEKNTDRVLTARACVCPQVTPSSKCVGDLALYLVTRGLKAADVTDPAKKGQVDFPDSVVGLLEGRLGFPHRGFPEEVHNIKRGAKRLRRTVVIFFD